MHEVFRDMYEALGVTDSDRIMKSTPEEDPRPTDPAQENINALDQLPLYAFQGQNHQAHIMSHIGFWHKSYGCSDGSCCHFGAEAHYGTCKDSRAGAGYGSDGNKRVQWTQNSKSYSFKRWLRSLWQRVCSKPNSFVKPRSAGAGQPDPLVKLKEQELQIRAQAEQADAQLDQQKLQLDAQNQQMRGRAV